MLKQYTIKSVSNSNHADVVFFHIIQGAWQLKVYNFNINHNCND